MRNIGILNSKKAGNFEYSTINNPRVYSYLKGTYWRANFEYVLLNLII